MDRTAAAGVETDTIAEAGIVWVEWRREDGSVPFCACVYAHLSFS